MSWSGYSQRARRREGSALNANGQPGSVNSVTERIGGTSRTLPRQSWHPDVTMSSPARRPSPTPRRKREQRAYLATTVGGTAALVTVVTAVLALITSFTWTIPILAAIITVICY